MSTTAAPPTDSLIQRMAPLSSIPGCGDLVAHVAPDVFALWDMWEKESANECPIPYWAVAWPGAVLLARHLLADPSISDGRSVLDLGCGGGLAGISAKRAGAREVVCNDIDPVALAIAGRNSRANDVSVVLDSRDLVEGNQTMQADLVLAADLFYERSRAAQTLEFLKIARRGGARVLIADGERAFAPQDGVNVVAEERIVVNRELEGTSSRLVRLLLLEE